MKKGKLTELKKRPYTIGQQVQAFVQNVGHKLHVSDSQL